MLFKSSSRRPPSTSLTDRYEYVNEDEIDDDIKCTICIQPWQSPVSLDCQHTFCEACINKWLRTETTCPICRANSLPRKLTDPTICNQLDNLPVRCLRCKKIGIPRSHFPKHFQRCSKGRIAVLTGWIPKRWSWKKKSPQPKPTCPEIINTNTYPRIPPPVRNVYTRPFERIVTARPERRVTTNRQVRSLSNVFIFLLIGIGVIVFRKLILFMFCLVGVVMFVLCLFLFLIFRRHI